MWAVFLEKSQTLRWILCLVSPCRDRYRSSTRIAKCGGVCLKELLWTLGNCMIAHPAEVLSPYVYHGNMLALDVPQPYALVRRVTVWSRPQRWQLGILFCDCANCGNMTLTMKPQGLLAALRIHCRRCCLPRRRGANTKASGATG